MCGRRIRILLAKTGLDPHDRGIRLLAHSLKDKGGMDVFYSGLYRTIDEIVEMAMQHDVDVVGLGVHTGLQMTLYPELRNGLNRAGMNRVILIGGGVMPETDIESLKSSGTVSEIFSHNRTYNDVLEWLNKTGIPE
jgi:methylmalonyl-CoA mutase C-terminal domain/subunit